MAPLTPERPNTSPQPSERSQRTGQAPSRRRRSGCAPRQAGSHRSAPSTRGRVRAMLDTTRSPVTRRERRLRLPAAAADQDFAAPRSPKWRRNEAESGKSLQTPT